MHGIAWQSCWKCWTWKCRNAMQTRNASVQIQRNAEVILCKSRGWEGAESRATPSSRSSSSTCWQMAQRWNLQRMFEPEWMEHSGVLRLTSHRGAESTQSTRAVCFASVSRITVPLWSLHTWSLLGVAMDSVQERGIAWQEETWAPWLRKGQEGLGVVRCLIFFGRFSNSSLEVAPEILNTSNPHCTASFEGKRFLLQGLKLFVERWAARCHEDLWKLQQWSCIAIGDWFIPRFLHVFLWLSPYYDFPRSAGRKKSSSIDWVALRSKVGAIRECSKLEKRRNDRKHRTTIRLLGTPRLEFLKYGKYLVVNNS